MYTCFICQEEFKSPNGLGYHIKMTHKIKTQEYYDHYVKKDNEGICKYCKKNKTHFIGLIKGYRDHCSKSCSKHYQPNSKGWIHKEGSSSWNKGIPMTEEYYDNWYKAVKASGIWERTWNKGKKMDPDFKEKWLFFMYR